MSNSRRKKLTNKGTKQLQMQVDLHSEGGGIIGVVGGLSWHNGKQHGRWTHGLLEVLVALLCVSIAHRAMELPNITHFAEASGDLLSWPGSQLSSQTLRRWENASGFWLAVLAWGWGAPWLCSSGRESSPACNALCPEAVDPIQAKGTCIKVPKPMSADCYIRIPSNILLHRSSSFYLYRVHDSERPLPPWHSDWNHLHTWGQCLSASLPMVLAASAPIAPHQSLCQCLAAPSLEALWHITVRLHCSAMAHPNASCSPIWKLFAGMRVSAEVICIKEHAGRGAHFGNAFLVPDRANVEKNNTNKIKGNVVNGHIKHFGSWKMPSVKEWLHVEVNGEGLEQGRRINFTKLDGKNMQTDWNFTCKIPPYAAVRTWQVKNSQSSS